MSHVVFNYINEDNYLQKIIVILERNIRKRVIYVQTRDIKW